MSFIMETIKCKKCDYHMNIALGTFGYGMPKDCPNCKTLLSYEHIASGWHADNDGKLKPDFLKW